jgi:PST family polysaccharide transporter
MIGDAFDDGTKSAPPLARHAATGAIYIGGSQVARLVLTVATTIIVARILSPGDYGVVAMWAPIFAFVLLFQDFGFSTATIQAKTLTREQSNTLFWINIAASIVIAILLIIGAQIVGRFFGDPRVALVTAASASIALVSGLAIQHMALLNREMKFRELAVIAVASALAAAIATIVLAFYLRSFWALFLGNLASVVVQTILTWCLCRWRPSGRVSIRQTRELLSFGTHIAAFNLVNFFSRNADNILIGKVWGASQLGLYDRSYKLMMSPLQLINAPLSRVMLPVLSRLREEPDRYRKAYLASFQAILLATAPAAAVAVAASDQLVLLLLGPQWSAASPIFFWLSLIVIYQPAASSLGWLFISSGRSRAYAGWGIFFSLVTVAAFVIGLPGGPIGVARAYFVVKVLVALLLVFNATKGSPVAVVDLARYALPPFIAVGIILLLVRFAAGQLAPLPLLLLTIPLSYFIALASVWVTPHGREFLAELKGIVKGSRAAV